MFVLMIFLILTLKLDFYITSAEGGFYPADMTYHQPYWYCKIIILKIK